MRMLFESGKTFNSRLMKSDLLHEKGTQRKRLEILGKIMKDMKNESLSGNF